MSPATAATIDKLNVAIGAVGFKTICLVLASIQFGVGLCVKTRHDSRDNSTDRDSIAGRILAGLFLPLLAFTAVLLTGNSLHTSTALGIILISCCPGDLVSTIFAARAEADTDFSERLTMHEILFSLISFPLNYFILSALFLKLNGSWTAFPILETAKAFLLFGWLPLVLGIIFRHFLSDRLNGNAFISLNKFRMLLALVPTILSTILVLKVNASPSCVITILLITVVLSFLAHAAGFAAGSFLNFGLRKRRSLTIDAGLRNLVPALILLACAATTAGFPDISGMLAVVAVACIWRLGATLSAAAFFKSREKRITG